MKTKIVVTSILLLAFALQAKKYSVGVIEWYPWSIAYVAAEKGFWKQQGIEVEVKFFVDLVNGSQNAFKHKQTDFTLIMLGDAIEMTANGYPTPIIYESDWSHGGDMLIVKNDISSFSSLKGQKIALYQKTAPVFFFLKKIFDKENISINDVANVTEIADRSNMVKAFKAGVFAGVIIYDPFATQLVNEKAGRKTYSTADFQGVMPEGISVQSEILKSSPDDVKKFLKGWLQAVKWQADPKNFTELTTILNKNLYSAEPKTEDYMKEFKKGCLIHVDKKDIITRNTKGLEEYYKELIEFLKQTGLQPKTIDIKDYIQTDIAVSIVNEK